MLAAEQVLALALACAPQVEPGTVQAIVARESGSNPFAIGTGRAAKLSHQPVTEAHALHVAGVLQKAGVEFDVGIAQIRTTNIRRFGLTVKQALEPCTNMKLMQRILLEAHERAVRVGFRTGSEASVAAVSAYNTGDLRAGLRNGYVAGVLRAHPRSAIPAHTGPGIYQN